MSRRAAVGMASLLALVGRPAPAPAEQRFGRWLHGTPIRGEVLELSCIGEGMQLTSPGGPTLPPVADHRRDWRVPPDSDTTPWGWDTLENVR